MDPNVQPCPTLTPQPHRGDHAGRAAWEKLLADQGNGGFLLTLGFRVYLDPTRAIGVANHFLLRVNRRLYGKRFTRMQKFLSGFVALERKRRSTRSDKSPHFHFVVFDRNLSTADIDAGKLRVASQDAANQLRYPTLDAKRPLGGLVSGAEFVDVRRVDEACGLADYLTKECASFGTEADAKNIGFFDVDGILGLEIFQ